MTQNQNNKYKVLTDIVLFLWRYNVYEHNKSKCFNKKARGITGVKPYRIPVAYRERIYQDLEFKTLYTCL